MTPPMPLKWTRNPDFIALPCAGAGIAFRLTLHFWETGCRPLPRATNELIAIARANRATWKLHAASIRAVIDAATDELERALHHRQARILNITKASHTGVASRRAAMIAQSVAPSPLTVATPRKGPPKAVRMINTDQTRLTD